MGRKLIPAAIIYDFDGTLSPINMQEHEFIPRLGMTNSGFWRKVKSLSAEQNACEILCYMHLMLAEAKHQDIPVNKAMMAGYGKDIELFKGVEEWFDRINSYAKKLGIRLHHFVVSSGVKPLIEGTRISKHFDEIFACDFLYDADGKPYAPGVAVDYTSKTQYIFRINKGCHRQSDNGMINSFVPMDERPIPLENMIFIGDGSTDIPAMKMTSHYGGLAIAVHKPGSKTKKASAVRLVREGRALAYAPADYRSDKSLERIVLRKLASISSQWQMAEALKRAS